MTKIEISTKSKDRFMRMRARYLGDITKKHPVFGTFGQRDKNYVSWGYNQKVINEYIMPRIENKFGSSGMIENILLINDFTFELTNAIIDKYDVKNIIVRFIVKDEADENNIKEWIEDYFRGTEQLKIEFLRK